MSILSVTERRGYDHSYALGKYAPDRKHTRRFWVYSSVRNEVPETVRTASGIPQLGDLLASDSGVRVVSHKLSRDEDEPRRWEVDVEYSSYAIGDAEEPPDTETATRISIITEQGNVLIERDVDDVAIKNTAGDLIEGIEIPWNNLGLQIEQAVAGTPDYYSLSTWINAINSAEWRGIPAYFAQIRSMSYDSDTIEGVVQWRRVTQVRIANVATQPWGYRLRLLNAGLREKVSGVLNWINDDTTQIPVSKPVPLKSDGTKAGLADAPHFLDFKVYPELAFATLGI